jgi:thiamine-monophosphate kinase
VKRSADAGRTLPLGPGAEFDRIRQIARVLGTAAAGLGDDCAIIPDGKEFLALSTDTSVEGVHFRLDWMQLDDVGWRAAAAALSDLAAEGAEPVGLLCAVTVPHSSGEADLLKLMRGVGAVAEQVHAPVIGGDLSAGPAWSVTVTVVGRTRAPVTRGGAKAGDGIWVTGTLGASRAALEALRSGRQPSAESRERFIRPLPRIAAGRWLARNGAHAMIDLSDGLGGDAAHIAAASAVSLSIDLNLLPLSPDVSNEARLLGFPAGQFAAEGGEDYELLVVMPPEFDSPEGFVSECGIPLTAIGSIQAGDGVSFLLDSRPIALQGFDHFG